MLANLISSQSCVVCLVQTMIKHFLDYVGLHDLYLLSCPRDMMKCMSLSTKKCAPVSINIFGLLSVVSPVIGHNGFNEKPETGWFRMGVNIDKDTASILEQRHHHTCNH